MALVNHGILGASPMPSRVTRARIPWSFAFFAFTTFTRSPIFSHVFEKTCDFFSFFSHVFCIISHVLFQSSHEGGSVKVVKAKKANSL